MNKILTIAIMLLCNNALASDVLDSEATDFEYELAPKTCQSPRLKACMDNFQPQPPIYTFDPTQMGGVFRVQPDWYIANNKIWFVPVPR